MFRVLLLTAILGAGCSAGGVPSGGEKPTDIVTGIYNLTISTESDSCDPKRITGDGGQATVQMQPDHSALTILVYNLHSANPVPLFAADGYANDVGPLTAYCLSGVMPGTMSEQLQLLDVGDGTFTVQSISDYAITQPCNDGPNQTSVGLDGLMPQASCHAERTFHYSLLTPCPAPKRIVDDTDAEHADPAARLHFQCVD